MTRLNKASVDGTSGPKITNSELDDAVAQFLANGGKVTNLKEDDGEYEKGLKKIERKLGGGFNPFSKEDALSTD